jgi:hypothetical protein
MASRITRLMMPPPVVALATPSKGELGGCLL